MLWEERGQLLVEGVEFLCTNGVLGKAKYADTNMGTWLGEFGGGRLWKIMGLE